VRRSGFFNPRPSASVGASGLPRHLRISRDSTILRPGTALHRVTAMPVVSNPFRSRKGIPVSHESSDPALATAIRKAYTRLLPLLFLCYVIAYVDRTNVAIAKLTMVDELPAFTNDVIGLGAGIFFLGYFLLEIPGSIIVERWSARKWICRIMVTWGICAAATAFVTTPTQFYVVRFLLGLAEAGFFPGIIVYLTHWFPARERARALSIFLVASPVAMIIGPALSRLLLPIGTQRVVDGATVVHERLLGLAGWQWIYIAWGVPAVVLGLLVLVLMPDRPRDASWLSADEADALEGQLAADTQRQKAAHMSVGQALTNPRVLLLALAYFGIVTANYGIEFFLPSILKATYDLKLEDVTVLVMLPSLLVIVGQILVGWNSDRTGERRWHACLPVFAGAAALVAAATVRGNLPLTVACFVVAAAGMKAYMPAFWALPNLFLASTAAAGSVGMINSIGNLGGFLGPTLLGALEKATGSFTVGLLITALTATMSACLIAVLPFAATTRHTPVSRAR
jgi:ACS family tartrate transporter-like MFS transporter